jgi:hypothetical protein
LATSRAFREHRLCVAPSALGFATISGYTGF